MSNHGFLDSADQCGAFFLSVLKEVAFALSRSRLQLLSTLPELNIESDSVGITHGLRASKREEKKRTPFPFLLISFRYQISVRYSRLPLCIWVWRGGGRRPNPPGGRKSSCSFGAKEPTHPLTPKNIPKSNWAEEKALLAPFPPFSLGARTKQLLKLNVVNDKDFSPEICWSLDRTVTGPTDLTDTCVFLYSHQQWEQQGEGEEDPWVEKSEGKWHTKKAQGADLVWESGGRTKITRLHLHPALWWCQ